MAKTAQTQQLTFNRMREINMWAKTFAFIQWCLVPCLFLSLVGLCNVLMWTLGQMASREFPGGGPAADRSVLYSSWRVAPAIFYAATSMCLSVACVRWAIRKVWRRNVIFRPWLSPSAASADFLKLTLAVALATALLFYATFIAEYQLPQLPAFLKPPSTLQGGDYLDALRDWATTRGLQFVFVSFLGLMLAQHALRLGRYTILPRERFVPVFLAYTLLFELFYSLSNRTLAFLFYGTYDQARSLVIIGPQLLLALLLFATLFACSMVLVSRKMIRPNFPVECSVVLAGVTDAGKTRFFGEALKALTEMDTKAFQITVPPETDRFLAGYESRRRNWLLTGTTLPERLSFSIESQNEVIRFNWQDIPGGVVTGTLADDTVTVEWKDELYSANALCVFFDCERLAKVALKDYPNLRKLKAVPFEFVRQLRQRNDFERPPVICVIGTKTDRIDWNQEHRVRAALHEFAETCRRQIRAAGLPRGYVGVRLTSTMMNMRGQSMPHDADETTSMPDVPYQRDCGQTLMWVAAKIVEAKSLGLDGPVAAFRGKATPFGEVQIDLEELAS